MRVFLVVSRHSVRTQDCVGGGEECEGLWAGRDACSLLFVGCLITLLTRWSCCAVLRRQLRRLAASLGDEQPILAPDDEPVDYSRTISLDRPRGKRLSKKGKNISSEHTHTPNTHTHT